MIRKYVKRFAEKNIFLLLNVDFSAENVYYSNKK